MSQGVAVQILEARGHKTCKVYVPSYIHVKCLPQMADEAIFVPRYRWVFVRVSPAKTAAKG